jgi:hypothetical protein
VFSFRLLDIWVTSLANNLFMTSYTLVRTWLHPRIYNHIYILFVSSNKNCLKRRFQKMLLTIFLLARKIKQERNHNDRSWSLERPLIIVKSTQKRRRRTSV